MEQQARNEPKFDPDFLIGSHFILKLVQMIIHLVLFGFSLKEEEIATQLFDLEGRNSWVSLYMILFNCGIILAGTFSILTSYQFVLTEMFLFFSSLLVLFSLNIVHKYTSTVKSDTHYLPSETEEISYARLGPFVSLFFQLVVIISQSLAPKRTITCIGYEEGPPISEDVEMDEFERSDFQSDNLDYLNEPVRSSQIRAESASRPESVLGSESSKRKFTREESFSPKRRKPSTSEKSIETMTLETSKVKQNPADFTRACIELKESTAFFSEIEMPLSLSIKGRSRTHTGVREEKTSTEEGKCLATSSLRELFDSASEICKSSSKLCSSSTSPNDSNSPSKQGNILSSSKNSLELASSTSTEMTVSSMTENGDGDSSKLSEDNILSRRGGKSDTTSSNIHPVVLESSELTSCVEKDEDLIHSLQDASVSARSRCESRSGTGIEGKNSPSKEKSQ